MTEAEYPYPYVPVPFCLTGVVSHRAAMLFGYIHLWCEGKNFCECTHQDIADQFNITLRTAERTLDELVVAKVIKVQGVKVFPQYDQIEKLESK